MKLLIVDLKSPNVYCGDTCPHCGDKFLAKLRPMFRYVQLHALADLEFKMHVADCVNSRINRLLLNPKVKL